MLFRLTGRRLFSMVTHLLLLLAHIAIARSMTPGHHVNVCNFLPSELELEEIARGQSGADGSDNYSHRIITINKYTPREHILISIVEDETHPPHEYMYLAQATLTSGKPFGHFKSFDENLPMRKCEDKEVFFNDETMDDEDGEDVATGVTFEWVAPVTKASGPVAVIVTKVNMDMLQRHHHEQDGPEGVEEATGSQV